MGLDIDGDFITAAAPLLSAMAGFQKPKLHDIEGRRKMLSNASMSSNQKEIEGVKLEKHSISASDGHQLWIYHYKREDTMNQLSPQPAIVHLHGGGLIALSAADLVPTMSEYVLATGVQVFSIDYRLAPEHPYPTPLEDCWSGLKWVFSKASDFRLDNTSIAVMGESAGGNLAAALALLARDRELSPPIAKQILIYPMLDDRNSSKAIGPVCMWDEVDNVTGWTAYLGHEPGRLGVPMFAAPARVESVEGLPPLYLDVGQLDLYMLENLEYAGRFVYAGIETELHIYPGLPHAFEALAPSHYITKMAKENRYRAIRQLKRDSM
ncbi:hypothetical protein COCC4DRAFT_155354 [Bipolaris maydis ATCC 48331]|uniref:Alpha/beta hydrolase fold-3 domain-containing protein n=2 Tax=Cochliobolus heterostrophus TaxID=5016 RepID=M2VD65_COCH5|nr:uncharacterized protein COCC4DRAFT_155354 [Bipolaris maydis ATCC 48331]EMD97942.1 hypothetical protein COCHEDRAFT_1085209 [Bipolaris maydis C5]KAH7564388.1 hypothetical protein BM1_01435 [Bipolaris maydis]ENH98605.1 hypothetical protein COCC4DRAFT_155354 [Bipolaris maydis ATCC 48331]KAJ5031996.1 Alpha/Beta hydrolase protein [Bipolaris maydis]KAJ5046926.1 esterase/lipase [Bipolaris maydis]